MYVLHRKTLVAVVAVALVALSVPAVAQEGGETQRFSIEARSGFAFPAGELQNLVDPGFTVGGGLGFAFHRNFGVRADVDVGFLQEDHDLAGQALPPMNALNVNGGVEVAFDRPDFQDFPLTTTVNLGLGLTRLSVDDTFTHGVSAAYNDFEHTYFTVNGGVKLGWQITETVNLFASGTSYLVFMSDKDTRILTEDPNLALAADPFETAWIFPVTLGGRVTVQ